MWVPPIRCTYQRPRFKLNLRETGVATEFGGAIPKWKCMGPVQKAEKKKKNNPFFLLWSFPQLVSVFFVFFFVCYLMSLSQNAATLRLWVQTLSACRGPAHHFCALGFLSHLLQDRSLQKSSQASLFPEAFHPCPWRVGCSESTVPSTARRSRHQDRRRQETGPTTVSPNTWWYHWPEARTSRTLGPALPTAALGRMLLTPTNPNPPHTHTQASSGARKGEVAGQGQKLEACSARA